MSNYMAVETKGLIKSFNQKEVIRNCTMKVKRGSIYGFLGSNGAGKTTIFKMLTGFLIPNGGSSFILERDMILHRNELQQKIGSIIEAPIFYEHLSAVENLEIHLSYMGLPSDDIDNILQTVGLSSANHEPVCRYSMGMRQRLGIARAIIHKPELLILDEPINGLDPIGIRDMRNLFLRLVQKENMTILFSSHILSEIEQVADTIGILVNGTVVKEIELEEARKEAENGLEEYFLSLMNGGAVL